MLKIRFWSIFLLSSGIALFTSCSDTEMLQGPSISFEIPADGFKVEVGKSLPLSPNVQNDEKSSYRWELNGQIVSSSKLFTFTPSKIGSYNLNLLVSNQIGSDNKSILISVYTTHSPYISRVFDYQYGPGQHAALIPSGWKGEDFIGMPWSVNKQYTSLGGWGGYIVGGFDHTVTNGTGADFAIFTQPGAASEPGVVFVMNDLNGDGIPNDGEWAEIRGSEYDHAETVRNYQVTYYKPNSKGNVTWKDNKGGSGELIPVYDSSSWWWSGYGNKSEVVFTGVKLPNAYQNISVQADTENWVVRTGMFSFGYAECYNNTDYNRSLKANLFDISDAMGGNGQKVNLAGITFIKVQSGVFQVAGWLNEISTEISGAADISLVDYTNN